MRLSSPRTGRPAAPRLLSTTTFWPSATFIFSASSRATVSAEPPGGKPTQIFMMRSCATAAGAASEAAASAAPEGPLRLDLRIAHMDQAGIDISVCSLTCPNVYWCGEAVSVQAAREANENFAAAQARFPDRIRWFASLPWEYPQRALEELERSCAAGAWSAPSRDAWRGRCPRGRRFRL